MVRNGKVRQARQGKVWRGKVRHGQAGKVWQGPARSGPVSQGLAWTGTSRKQKGE